ncbi:MAG TPA: AraC family transcriptional regulator [Planktothrix sp.]|jgi:hypothetical protein
MDLLDDVLSSVQFRGMVYCQSEFSVPWGVKWEGRPGRAGFFMVLRGGCYFESTLSDRPIALGPGDFIMASRDRPYCLRDSPDSAAIKFDDLMRLLDLDFESEHRLIEYGGGGTKTKIIMGCYDFDTSNNNPFFASLPDFIYIRSEELQSEPWLETSIRFLASECSSTKLGSAICVRRLTEMVFVQAIRLHMNRHEPDAKTTWLSAVADPQIGRAISLVHDAPQEDWTVAQLAHSVGMSRSSFAAKFKELTDVSPP